MLDNNAYYGVFSTNFSAPLVVEFRNKHPAHSNSIMLQGSLQERMVYHYFAVVDILVEDIPVEDIPVEEDILVEDNPVKNNLVGDILAKNNPVGDSPEVDNLAEGGP